MKCLIVVPSLIRAGAETQAIHLANGLAKLGHQVHLCSFEHQLNQRSRIDGNVEFHHLLRRSKYDSSLVTRLANLIDCEKIDVVQGVLQFAALIAWLAVRRSRCKPALVAAVHTTINRGLKQELQDRLVYRYMLRRFASIIFVCENQREFWIQKYPELLPLARVVHNGVHISKFRKEEFVDAAKNIRRKLSIPENAPVFACIAAFRPEKGHGLLIRAFKSAPANAYLVLAGDGECRPSIEAEAAKARLGERVIFLGDVEDVRPIIVASTATVLASTAVETFSMAMLESMAMGTPVLAPRIGGLPEAIIPGQTGWLFDIGDCSGLVQCINDVALDMAKSKAVGGAANRLIAKKFSAGAMCSKNEKVLKEAIGQV